MCGAGGTLGELIPLWESGANRDGWQTWETEIRDMVDRDERHGNVVFGDPSQI